jgi:spermidine/putrescine-binding protein
VRFTLPEAQTVITPDCLAVLKNPPHPEMARRFLEFALSREGQLLWMLPKGAPGGATRNIINRMSVRPDLYTELAGKTPVLTDPFTLPAGFTLSASLSAQRRAILSVLIATCMIDSRDELALAWRGLNGPAAAKLSDSERDVLTADLIAPPCSLEELLHLAATDWNDPVKRTALVNRWQQQALHRYAAVTSRLDRSDR